MGNKCVWEKEDEWEDDNAYNTGCGHMFVIIAGSPEDNNFKFCTYCGKEIEHHKTVKVNHDN